MITFVVCLCIFSTGLCPFIYWGDDGLLISASATMGIGHPPGHPVYMLLNRSVLVVPFGNIAFRYNLMAAFWLSLAIAVLSGCLWQSDRPNGANIGYLSVFSLFILLHPYAWHQAVRAETYSLHAFLLAICLASICYRKGARGLFLGAFFAALMLGNQLFLAALAGPGLMAAWFVVWKRQCRKMRVLAISMALFVLGISVNMFTIIRADRINPVNWTILEDSAAKWSFISARMYQQSFFHGENSGLVSSIVHQMYHIGRYLASSSGYLMILLFALGLLYALRTRTFHLATVTTVIIAVMTLTGTAGCRDFSHENWDFQGYLLPVVLMMAVLTVDTMQMWSSRYPGYSKSLLILALLAGGLPFISPSQGGIRRLSECREAFLLGQAHLDATSPDGLVLVKSDVGFVTTYLNRIERFRDDVSVLSRNYLHRNMHKPEIKRCHTRVIWPDCWQAKRVFKACIGELIQFNSPPPISWELADDDELIAGLPAQLNGSLVGLSAYMPEFQGGFWRFATLVSEMKKADNKRLFSDRQAVEQLAVLFYNLGTFCLNRESAFRALWHFEKALELDPKQARIHNNYGVALTMVNRESEAIKAFQRALEIDPQYRGAAENMYRIGRDSKE